MPSLPRNLPRLCIALGLPTAAQLSAAAESEYKDGSTFLEFRLDYLRDPSAGLPVIETLSKRYGNMQILATCRGREHGGHFSGTIEQQIAILMAAGRAGSIAADLEIESAEQAKSAASELRANLPLIVSFHNFATTPALPAIYRRLHRVPADAYKLIVTARKPSDNLRLVEFIRSCTKAPPLIAFAMSEIGAPTRILAPSLGCLYTYAAPSAEAGTAPGQISGCAMRSLYRCEKLGKQTKIYGVIADPVAHTKSPVIHNRGFQARRLDCVYLPFLVPARSLSDWMHFAAALPVSGFSVTIPHKQRIIRHLDIVDPLAKRIGAVNTVWRRAGKWRGVNTDVDGIIKPLTRHLRLSGASILIAGYGGAARAACIALGDAGALLTVTGRNMQSAQTLARACKAKAVTLEDSVNQRFDALIHATPVGMASHSKGSLFTRQIPAEIVFDMVYNPRETTLIKRAKAQGCQVVCGSEMLLEQALRQFEIWTGESAPRDAMSRALEASLTE